MPALRVCLISTFFAVNLDQEKDNSGIIANMANAATIAKQPAIHTESLESALQTVGGHGDQSRP
jgi:hypothetical protein